MYEDIIKEMNDLSLALEKGKKEALESRVKDNEAEDNKKINIELEKADFNTIDYEKLTKITGVKNGKRNRK